MAVVSVAFDGTRVNTADALGTLWQDLGGGKTNLEPDFIYQRTSGTDGAISEKVGTSEGGVKYYDSGTSNDFTSAHASGLEATWIQKHIATNKDSLNALGSTGGISEIGSGDRANYHRYYMLGNDNYPKRGGWIVSAINPNVTAWRDATVGTPSLTAVDNYSWACDFSATSKAENVAMDALDFIRNGEGLTVTGGTGADDPAGFQDLVTFDEGTLSNSYGIVITFTGTVESGVGITGTISVGTAATAGRFVDSNKSVVFFGGRVAAGFSGWNVNLSQATSENRPSNMLWTSLGQSNRKQFFDTTSSVNGTTDVITTEDNHEYLTGDAVLYSKEGGTAAIGLTDATEYWVETLTATTLNLHTSRQNAITAATPVNLTASGTENHSLTRQPDTRSKYLVTGTTGVGDTPTGLTFVNWNDFTFTSKSTHTRCSYVGCHSLAIGSGTLDTPTVSEQTTTEGEAFITASTIENITDGSFTAGDEGHATDIDTAGAFSYSGNSHTSYGPDRAQFHTISDVNTTTDIITTKAAHGLTTGDAVYPSNHGGPDTTGLTSGTKYYVNAQTTTTLSFHRSRNNANADTNRTALSLGTNGEIHSIYSGKAAILNSIAATLVSSYAPSNKDTDYALGDGTTTARGQSFAATAGVLSRARFYLRKVLAPTGTAVAKLYAHSGTFGTSSVPTGSALATSKTFDVSQLETTNYAMVDFEFDDRFSLVAATNYVIVIEYSGGDASNYVQVGGDSSAPSHGGNAAVFTGTWAAQSGVDLVFYVYRGGEVVINIAGGGDTPTYRNSGSPPGVTIVNAAVTLTFEAVDKDDAAIQSVQVSAYAVDDNSEIILQDTNASGIATTSYSGSTPRDIYYRYRKSSTGATKYRFLSGFATIESGTGASVKRNMQEDDIADPTI